MATIKSLSNHDLDFVTIIQMVANIEAMVQAQEAWSCQAMVDLLEQDNNHILIAYDKGKEEKIASHKIVGYCLYQIVFEQAEILRIGT
ncbi:ribosomal protein S18-alanine N-acetyltransferase, partial [Psychrobacter sp. 1U2]